MIKQEQTRSTLRFLSAEFGIYYAVRGLPKYIPRIRMAHYREGKLTLLGLTGYRDCRLEIRMARLSNIPGSQQSRQHGTT